MAAVLTGRGVPASVRAAVEDLFSLDHHRTHGAIGRYEGQLGAELAAWEAADWMRLSGVLVPQLSEAAASTLSILSRRPFQRGGQRRPFRAPQSGPIQAGLRVEWLLSVTRLLGEYDVDVAWVAEHGGSLGGWWGAPEIGWLLAGAIDAGGPTGQRVFDVLLAVGRGEVAGQMGRHVIQALLSCGRPEAWDFVGKLLVAAQRQEGLRQSILESVDEAHPGAFDHMLRVILDEDLSRFSSVVRAADVWFGFLWDGASSVKVDSILERVLQFRTAGGVARGISDADAETGYLALWCAAFEDVHGAVELAGPLLQSPTEAIRFAATHFLVQSNYSISLAPLVEQLADPDLRVAARALDRFQTQLSGVDSDRLFSQLEGLLERVTARTQTIGALVWPWWKRKFERTEIAAAMVTNCATTHGDRVLRYVPDLDPSRRAAFLRTAAGLRRKWDPEQAGPPARLTGGQRGVAIELLGDSSADVRGAAFEALRPLSLEPDEVDRLFALLSRTAGDLRNGALARLATLGDPALLEVADRLLSDADSGRRLAGLELLRGAREAGRLVSEAAGRIARYQASAAEVSEQERAHMAAVANDTPPPTRDNALGLVDPTTLAPLFELRRVRIRLETTAAIGALRSLAELVLQHQQTEVKGADGQAQVLIESRTMGWWGGTRDDLKARLDSFPLQSVWSTWLRERQSALRDDDGCELLRALMANREAAPWNAAPVEKLIGSGPYRAGAHFLRNLLEWCVASEPPNGGLDYLLDGLEAEIAGFSEDDLAAMAKAQAAGRARATYYGEKAPAYKARLEWAEAWLRRVRWWRTLMPESVRPNHSSRLYGLLRAFEGRTGGFDALRVDLEDFARAYRAGSVGEADFVDLLAGRYSLAGYTPLLRQVSTRKPPPSLTGHPELMDVVGRCRSRIVAVETERGDRQTAGSGLTMALRWTGGLETLTRAVGALGKGHFTRNFGWQADGASRQEALSHLVLRSIPAEADTPQAFAAWARTARVGEGRLIELAVYAPQWARHVNEVLGWPGLESAVWWIEAHTKDDRSWRVEELKAVWAAEVSERTPLSPGDLTEGAVDVAWFSAAYGSLGAERWKKLDAAAKYAASSGGHTRAQLFARAMAGVIDKAELLGRIDASRHQDSVRALGLIPLAPGADRMPDLLARYQRLEEYRRQSRQFGSQRQQSEKRAVSIGLANLARTAGFRDPQRLQWAMERAAVADLAHGPLVVVRGEVGLSLRIDEDGEPIVETTKAGRPIKAVPAALKKDAEVVELQSRFQDLKRQRSRVRVALEEAMCRGDRFDPEEFPTLLEHPILAPGLSRLVFIGEGIAGYLAEGGRALRDHQGRLEPIGTNEAVRIAHPHDLLIRGDWPAWQADCYRLERVQPFKQVFRELYPIADGERAADKTRRYAGHQVNPRQALALLGGRGWVAHPDEGLARTFHEEGLAARLWFQEAFYSPADIEGLTLEEITFTKKGEWTTVGLAEVPPRLFSEAMRDVDLVVSVAHQGGVDPEASASTMEIRAALVRETCQLLGLTNVRLGDHHVFVQGTLAEYSVHLGSAGVFMLPGTALPIVAVHSQHRGRLFLPFADDDPRSAELLSKTLMLARDQEIKDPNILERIRGRLGG
ncbi:MAG: DUF5724 domain-containing protein [Gemmatimonadales bacterium]